MPRIVCVSDTHARHHLTEMPPGDVLVHAGDITRHGRSTTWKRSTTGSVVNHHTGTRSSSAATTTSASRSGRPRPGRGSPTRSTSKTRAARSRGSRSTAARGSRGSAGGRSTCRGARSWRRCGRRSPDGMDVLITHGPPEGILDRTNRGEFAGCRDLFNRVCEVRPRLHVFGHIHEAAGRTDIDDIIFVNASTQLGRGPGGGGRIGCEIAKPTRCNGWAFSRHLSCRRLAQHDRRSWRASSPIFESFIFANVDGDRVALLVVADAAPDAVLRRCPGGP